jgi:protein-disulfide isomerase
VRAAKADAQADAARAREILDRARARRRDRLEALRGAVADERAEAAPPADAPPNAAKPPTLAVDADVIRLGARSDVDLRGKATQTTTSLGLWGCLGKLMVLHALAVAALVVLNLGVQLVMEALGTHVASVDTSDPRTTEVSSALAPTTPPLRGGADEPLARIVFGFDPTDPAGWRVAAAVARLQDHRAEGTGWRLLLQPSDAEGYRVAFEVHELLAAGLPAVTLLDTLRVPSGAGGLRGRIDALRRDTAVAPARLRRDDEAHLRALARRVTQDAATSAALGIHEGTSGLLLGGAWIPPEDAGPAVLLERLRAEALDVAAALEVAPDDAARLEARLVGPTVSRRVAWNDLVVKGLPPAVEDGRVDNALRMALGSDAPSRQVRLRVPRRAPTQGPAEAPVQLVVVHDYRDAASRALAEDVERLRLAWGDTVVVRWMFAPGDGGHDHGDGDHAAALVALSAAQQGGFDAAHAALLEAEGQMSPAAVSAWVDELAARDPGFDAARFGRDLRRAPRSLRRMRSRLDKVGVRSAPAVLVGRQLLDGVPDYASLDRAVQREAAQRGEQGAP